MQIRNTDGQRHDNGHFSHRFTSFSLRFLFVSLLKSAAVSVWSETSETKFLCFASKRKEFRFRFAQFSLQQKTNGAPYSNRTKLNSYKTESVSEQYPNNNDEKFGLLAFFLSLACFFVAMRQHQEPFTFLMAKVWGVTQHFFTF
jgi:hypothetical protein